MSRSTRMTPEQLSLLGLIEVSPGVYKKKGGEEPITIPATPVYNTATKKWEDTNITIRPDTPEPPPKYDNCMLRTKDYGVLFRPTLDESHNITPEMVKSVNKLWDTGKQKSRVSEGTDNLDLLPTDTQEFTDKYGIPNDNDIIEAVSVPEEEWLQIPTELPVRPNPMTPDEAFIPSVPFVRTWSPKTTDRDNTDYYIGVDPAKIGQEKTVIVKHHQGNVEVIYSSPDLITLTVLGDPKPQKRHRHYTPKGAGFTKTYDPSKADKSDFLAIIQQNAPEKPLDQPLRLDINFYFARPKSHFKSGKNSHLLKDTAPTWHTGRPDVDNLFKFCTDALTKVYWRDDSLVCCTNIIKKYDDVPRTEITIIPL